MFSQLYLHVVCPFSIFRPRSLDRVRIVRQAPPGVDCESPIRTQAPPTAFSVSKSPDLAHPVRFLALSSSGHLESQRLACCARSGQSALVSFDIFLQAFRNGGGSVGDGSAVLRLIEGMVTHRGNGWASIATADGEADIYGLDDPATGVMANHLSGAADALLYDIARSAGFVVMPTGCPTCLPDGAMHEHLPAELVVDAVIIESGDDLRRVIESS
jgi:hypothetical protein